ncbi:MAG: ankyrin repeat domain-containing protein [Phycisphaerales bacterium]|nr:ankyrin repeat domain-containing protein [Phycisphaerales bacterium]
MTNNITKTTLTLALIATMLGISVGCEQNSEETTTQAETTKTEVASVSTVDSSKPALEQPEITPAKTKKQPDDTASLKPSAGLNQKAPERSSQKPDTKNPLQPQETPEVKEQVVVLEPAQIDLGKFSTSEKGTGSVKLTNSGSEPVTITRAKASCGCTTSDFKNNTVLQPGESTEISVTMNGKGKARKLTKTVTFTVDGYPPLRLPVVAETISYVTLDVEPLVIDDAVNSTTITLTSLDDQPFKITSMIPDIVEEIQEEAASSQELTIDWDLFWDVVTTTKITIRLDHPLCKEITTNVRLSADQRQRLNKIISDRRAGGDLPTKDPTKPLTGDQLARYIKSGRGEKVIKYINDGLGKFNAVNREGVSLLMVASEEGDYETVSGLIELGAQLERVDRINRTPLMYAARAKNPEVIQVLLDAGADIQARSKLGNTPLSWASGFGPSVGVQLLVDAGADANTVDTVLGYTPLVWASGFGDPNSIPILIEAGADIEVNDIAEGRTPLMHSVRTGKLECVKFLISAGANVNAIDNDQETALHVGALSNNVTIDKIKLLIDSGADVNAKNKNGETPLDLAKTRTDDSGPEIVAYLTEKTK